MVLGGRGEGEGATVGEADVGEEGGVRAWVGTMMAWTAGGEGGGGGLVDRGWDDDRWRGSVGDGGVGDDDRGGVLGGWLVEDGGGRVGFAEWVASGCFCLFFSFVVWRLGAEGQRVGLKEDDAVGRVGGGGRR